MLPHHVSDHKIIQVKVVLQRLGQTELTFKKGQQYKKPCWLSTRRWNHLFHTAFTQGMQDDWKEVCACMEDPAQSLSLHDSSEDLGQSLVDYMWKFTTTKLLWTFKTAYYLALLELPDNPDCLEEIYRITHLANNMQQSRHEVGTQQRSFEVSGNKRGIRVQKLRNQLGRALELKLRWERNRWNKVTERLVAKLFPFKRKRCQP